MLRAFGAVILFGICTVFGKLRTEKYRGRLDVMNAIIEDLRAVETDLRCERCSAPVLISRLAKVGRLRPLWQEMLSAMQTGCSYGDAWNKSKKMLCSADAEELGILDTFSGKFGAGDADTELSRLERTISRLELIEKRLKAEYPNRIKLAGTLSMLCGLAFALMIL